MESDGKDQGFTRPMKSEGGGGIAAGDVSKNSRVLPNAQTDEGGKKQTTRQGRKSTWMLYGSERVTIRRL